MSRAGSRRANIERVREEHRQARVDELAVEEPLEIRVRHAGDEGKPQSVSVTMRTPGNDFELAVGFLFTEGLLRGREDLRSVESARSHVSGSSENVVDVILEDGVVVDIPQVGRNFYTTSSCGVCGKASLESIRVSGVRSPPAGQPRVPSALLPRLPDRLREGQTLFSATGGLHAAGRFNTAGELLSLREDVGRHNAVDKLVGERVLAGRVPANEEILVVSGRASFEILQKAAVAGFPIVVAVGAPTSLAVDLAQEFGLTLVGFARTGGYNVYAGRDRILQTIVEEPRP